MKLGVLSLWSGRDAGGAAAAATSSDGSRISALPALPPVQPQTRPDVHLPEGEGAAALFDGRAAGSTRPPQKSGRFAKVTPEMLELSR
jgi:hypothetical protein